MHQLAHYGSPDLNLYDLSPEQMINCNIYVIVSIYPHSDLAQLRC